MLYGDDLSILHGAMFTMMVAFPHVVIFNEYLNFLKYDVSFVDVVN
ncbi:hypothetical protein [Methanobrevibacter sp.]